MNHFTGAQADLTRCLPYIVAAPLVYAGMIVAWMSLTNGLLPLLPDPIFRIFGLVTLAGYLAILISPLWYIPRRLDPNTTVRSVLMGVCPMLVLPIGLSFY